MTDLKLSPLYIEWAARLADIVILPQQDREICALAVAQAIIHHLHYLDNRTEANLQAVERFFLPWPAAHRKTQVWLRAGLEDLHRLSPPPQKLGTRRQDHEDQLPHDRDSQPDGSPQAEGLSDGEGRKAPPTPKGEGEASKHPSKRVVEESEGGGQ